MLGICGRDVVGHVSLARQRALLENAIYARTDSVIHDGGSR